MDLSVPSAVADHKSCPSGFTFVEMLVVMGIIATMSLIAYFSVSRVQVSADIETSVDKVLATIQSQRMLAMLGGGDGEERRAVAQGIHFEANTNKYTMFSCVSEQPCLFSSTDLQNIEYVLEASTVFSRIDLKDSQVIFAPYSGEVYNYLEEQSSVEIYNRAGNLKKTIQISSVGTPSLLP